MLLCSACVFQNIAPCMRFNSSNRLLILDRFLLANKGSLIVSLDASICARPLHCKADPGRFHCRLRFR